MKFINHNPDMLCLPPISSEVKIPLPIVSARLKELCRFDCGKTIQLVLSLKTVHNIECISITSDWSQTFRVNCIPYLPCPQEFSFVTAPLVSNQCCFDGHSNVFLLKKNQTMVRGEYFLSVTIDIEETAEVDFVSGTILGCINYVPFQVGYIVDLCKPFSN